MLFHVVRCISFFKQGTATFHMERLKRASSSILHELRILSLNYLGCYPPTFLNSIEISCSSNCVLCRNNIRLSVSNSRDVKFVLFAVCMICVCRWFSYGCIARFTRLRSWIYICLRNKLHARATQVISTSCENRDSDEARCIVRKRRRGKLLDDKFKAELRMTFGSNYSVEQSFKYRQFTYS